MKPAKPENRMSHPSQQPLPKKDDEALKKRSWQPRTRRVFQPPGKDDTEKAIEMEGTITAVLAGTMFRVQLPNEHLVLAHISGKMRKRFIRLVVGDRVKIEMSPYDKDKARIVYRMQ